MDNVGERYTLDTIKNYAIIGSNDVKNRDYAWRRIYSFLRSKIDKNNTRILVYVKGAFGEVVFGACKWLLGEYDFRLCLIFEDMDVLNYELKNGTHGLLVGIEMLMFDTGDSNKSKDEFIKYRMIDICNEVIVYDENNDTEIQNILKYAKQKNKNILNSYICEV